MVPQVPHHTSYLSFKCFAFIFSLKNLLPSGQVKPIKAKDAFDDKKAANATINATRNEQHLSLKEGEPCIYKIITFIKYCSANAALPAPQELFVEALFAIDARVIITPDTAPGVDPAQSVALCGIVVKCKLSVDGWSYRVRANDSRRNIIWVPEARVRAVSKTIFESPILETRAFPAQQRLKAKHRKSATLRV